VYALIYFVRFTREPLRLLTLAVPHAGVIVSLALGSVLCSVSERFIFASPIDTTSELLIRAAAHAVSGAVAVSLFAAAVYVFEKRFRTYVGTLRRGRAGAAGPSTAASSGTETHKRHAE
jgi:hypothetical protein